ncbi:cation-transporting P-type ATPase [Acidovorax sp.]|jgi:hypothetical protein|uniref:cation-transporting P-type ATPase n=1 Tax=Acidovorax sp. TaxID=1872122 RepID=UPI003456DF40|nr:hypothetical protein [Acidovorax sp.]
MNDASRDASYWSQDVAVLAATFDGGTGGLTSSSASAQRAAIGPYSVEDAPRLSALRLLLRQFESPRGAQRQMVVLPQSGQLCFWLVAKGRSIRTAVLKLSPGLSE